MQWIVAAVKTGIDWPTTDSSVEYAGREFVLRPESKEVYADIVTRLGVESRRQKVEGELFRFCSIVLDCNRSTKGRDSRPNQCP